MKGVIRTDEWLLEDYKHPIQLAHRVKDYFPNAEAEEIFAHLTKFGMTRSAIPKKRVQQMQAAKLWNITSEDYKELQHQWNGPEVPIFIFPSDETNYRLRKEFNGKAGLTFKDKAFLFLSESNTQMEIKALLTHEYNHVCRLEKFNKPEKQYTLLDTIILEGMAEYAVFKRLGEEHTASYIGKYQDEVLHRFWTKYLSSEKGLRANTNKYYRLLYGSHFYPKMLGYCVGEYLVRTYANKHGLALKELFAVKSEEIAETTLVTPRD